MFVFLLSFHLSWECNLAKVPILIEPHHYIMIKLIQFVLAGKDNGAYIYVINNQILMNE